MQISLDAAGIAAPRDTDLQEKAIGSPLAFDADLTGLRRGNVVFSRGHVGIMRDGTMLPHANTMICWSHVSPWAQHLTGSWREGGHFHAHHFSGAAIFGAACSMTCATENSVSSSNARPMT